MGLLRRIETRLEGIFEGGIGRTFRSHVQPVELARKLAKEMDDNKVISVSQVYVPNVFTVFLAEGDREQFLAYEARLRTELAGYLTEHARREGYVLPGRARVLIETAEELEVGTFGIAAEMEETPPPVDPSGPTPPPPGVRLPEEFDDAAPPTPAAPAVPPAPAVTPPPPPAPAAEEDDVEAVEEIVDEPVAAAPSAPAVEPAPPTPSWTLTWSGGSLPIGDAPLVIGRSRDCEVVVADGNVSRRHAEVARAPEGFVVRDLESTNGTLVNGRRIRRAVVGAGDDITVGTTTLRIERRSG